MACGRNGGQVYCSGLDQWREDRRRGTRTQETSFRGSSGPGSLTGAFQVRGSPTLSPRKLEVREPKALESSAPPCGATCGVTGMDLSTEAAPMASTGLVSLGRRLGGGGRGCLLLLGGGLQQRQLLG